MDISFILSRIPTLSDARKQELTERYTNGTLTDDDKKELYAHVTDAMDATQSEMEVAKGLLAQLKTQ